MSDANNYKTPAPQQIGIFAVINWILGGLSLLNLIRELSPIKLYGLVAEWTNAYNMVFGKLVRVLFGWAQWEWMTVSPIEGHVIILLVLLLGTLFRMIIAVRRASHKIDGVNSFQSLGLSFGASLTLFFVLFVGGAVALTLPEPLGLIALIAACCLLLAFIVKGFLMNPKEDALWTRRFRVEFIGMFVVVGGVVLANYLFFKP